MSNEILLVLLFVAIVFVALWKRSIKRKRIQATKQKQALIPETIVNAVIPESVMEELPEEMVDSLPHNEMIETFDDVRSIKLNDIKPTIELYNTVDNDNYFYINRPVDVMPASIDTYPPKMVHDDYNNGFSNIQLLTVCIIFVLTIILLYGVTFTRKLK